MKSRASLLLLCLLLASGCSTTIEVRMRGQADMNSGGNAVVVQVYELTGEGDFLSTSPQSFWQENGALASILVGSPRRETLYPNGTTTFELELAEETKFIGVAANLRNPDPEEWRALYPVEEIGDWLSVTVQGSRISVQAEGGGALHGIGLSSRHPRSHSILH